MESSFEERLYRKWIGAEDLVSYRVVVKESDLWVLADENLEKETRDLLIDCRHQLESYMHLHPEFATRLTPYASDPTAPPIVKDMIHATEELGVGPMASVAGAVADYVGRGLLKFTDQVIVENGGDVFIKTDRPVTVSIFAGKSPLSGRIGLHIRQNCMPLGVCSSSSTIGHSLSMGRADLVSIASPSAAFADGAATALGNKIRVALDMKKVATWAQGIDRIMGGLIILDTSMATWGDIELVEL